MRFLTNSTDTMHYQLLRFLRVFGRKIALSVV